MATAPLTQEQADLHLLIKDIYSTHDPLLHITTAADRAKIVNALIAAGYVRLPQPGVPVEYQWGTSPYADGSYVSQAVDEDAAVWRRTYRGHHVFRRPVPAAWELVQP